MSKLRTNTKTKKECGTHVWRDVLVPVAEQAVLVLRESPRPLEPHNLARRDQLDPLLAVNRNESVSLSAKERS